MRPDHRVAIVRAWDAQTSGSGCCGRLDGAAVTCDGKVLISGRVPEPGEAIAAVADDLATHHGGSA